MTEPVDREATVRTKVRYDRNAPFYDVGEYMVERFIFRNLRRCLWSRVPLGRGLEVGVGTGKNISYYPRDTCVTAVDLSPRMIRRAQRRAARLGAVIDLAEMDAQRLAFPDDSFDWAAASFVFCSVPDPVMGLQELGRVVKPGGRILLLEHVRIDKPVLGWLMDVYNPLAVRLTGANINRRTVRNLAASGLEVESVEDVAPLGVVKLATARPA